MELFKKQQIHCRALLQASKHLDKADQKGFVLITTITLLPLLLTLCILLVAFTNHAYVHISALNLCRKHLLIGQDKIRYQMKKLIDLNPDAQNLRDQHDRALRRLNSSVTPPQIAINGAKYAAVLAKQALFAARQYRHIFIANSEGQKQKTLLEKKLKKLNKNTSVQIDSFPFSLERQQLATLTPDYLEVNDFKKAQTVRASWVMSGFNKRILSYLKSQVSQPNVKSFCGSTIDNKKGEKWQAVLMKKGKLL